MATVSVPDNKTLRRLSQEWVAEQQITSIPGNGARFPMEFYRILHYPPPMIRLEQKNPGSLMRLRLIIHSIVDGPFVEQFRRLESEFGRGEVELEIKMPDDYPMSPPKACVIWPRMHGGYVFETGAICFQMFSHSGWSCSTVFEVALIQLQVLLFGGDRCPTVDFTATRNLGPITDTARAYEMEEQLLRSHTDWQQG